VGGLGSRFGRNVPLDHAVPDPDDCLLEPNPRRISLELLSRDRLRARDPQLRSGSAAHHTRGLLLEDIEAHVDLRGVAGNF
jgi:hypothetical protein